MSSVRALGPFLLTSFGLTLAVGCDDPAPNRPAPALVHDTATSQSSAAAPASAAPPASAAAEAAPVDSTVAPAPTPVAEAPTPSGAASIAAPSAPASPRKSSARSGILQAAESDAILPAGSPARVVLLESGAEPRSTTRYAFTTGATTPMEMSIAMTLEVAQGERTAPPQSIPRITTLLDFVSASAPTEGALGIDATLKKMSIAEDTGVSKQIAERLLPMLKGLEGLSLRYEVTPAGRIKRSGTKLSGAQKGNPAVDGTVAQMTQSVESMIVAFPDEPIGLGGRWEVVTRVNSSGADLLQWVTYQLKERDEKGATLGLEVVQAAAKPEMTPPGAPAGFSAKVVELVSNGTGDTTIEFASPAPRKSKVALDTKMALQVAQANSAGGTMSMKSKVVVDMRRAGKGADQKPDRKQADPKPADKKPVAPAPAPVAP